MAETFDLSIRNLNLEGLAKVVLALKGTPGVVIGGGAATPAGAPNPALGPVATASVVASAPAPVPPAPPAAPPVPTGALTQDDVMTAFKAALARIKAPGVQFVNAQFGISGPLALKDRPQDWAGYIAALNAAPAAA